VNEQRRYQLPEALELETETLERVALHTEAWARSLERSLEIGRGANSEAGRPRSPEEIRREIASLYTIAGSYRLLLEPREAAASLRSAAAHFALTGSLFAHPLAVCSGDTSAGWIGEFAEGDRALSPNERQLILLRLGWLDALKGGRDQEIHAALFAHMDHAAPDSAAVVGRVRVPLDATMRLLVSVDRMSGDNGDREMRQIVASVHDFLIRAYDVTAAAMSDRLHWRSLMSSVLPVEPEAVALGAVVMASALQRGADEELINRLDLPPGALAPLIAGMGVAQMVG
jgi:hypothetical protein